MKKLAAIIAVILMALCCVSVFAQAEDLTPEGARAAALKYTGFHADEVSFTRCEAEWENGRDIYGIQFFRGDTEYDVDVDLATGEINDFHADGPEEDEDLFDDFFFDFD